MKLHHFLRLTIVGSKRKSPKRRNFKFGTTNGYGGVFMQSHFIRILPVKIPRFANGEVIDFDIYDLTQGEKIYKYSHNPYLGIPYCNVIIETSL